jgi:hypothetical protein
MSSSIDSGASLPVARVLCLFSSAHLRHLSRHCRFIASPVKRLHPAVTKGVKECPAQAGAYKARLQQARKKCGSSSTAIS